MRYAVHTLMLCSLAACAGAPATPQQREHAEQSLLLPFLSGTEVRCSELVVEMTGNFYGNVSQPTVDPQWHTSSKERHPEYTETVWTNTRGLAQSAFLVTIGQPGEYTERGIVYGPRAKFLVANRFRLRVYEDRRALQLAARATGDLVVVKEASLPQPRGVREYAVVDGAVQVR